MCLREDLQKVAGEGWQNQYVKIKPLLTEEQLIYAGFECEITESQKQLVNPFWFSIGRAYLFKEDNYPCVIYNAENIPIGFINFYTWLPNKKGYSWSFFIDKKHQGRGYGKASAQLAVCILKSANPKMPIKLATEVANKKAQALYRLLGFKQLAEKDGDDLIFEL